MAAAQDDWAVLLGLEEGLRLCERPFEELAARAGLSEDDFLRHTRWLLLDGKVRRLACLWSSRRLGFSSTLVAAHPAAGAGSEAVSLVNSLREVTHHYRRSSERFPLWFTLTARGPARLRQLLASLEESGLFEEAADLPSTRFFKARLRLAPLLAAAAGRNLPLGEGGAARGSRASDEAGQPAPGGGRRGAVVPSTQAETSEAPESEIRPEAGVKAEDAPAAAGAGRREAAKEKAAARGASKGAPPGRAAGAPAAKKTGGPVASPGARQVSERSAAAAGGARARAEAAGKENSSSADAGEDAAARLSDFEKRLVDLASRGLDPVSRPWLSLGEELGACEGEVLEALRSLKERGVLRRAGAVLDSRKLGLSGAALGCWRVEEEKVESVGRAFAAQAQVSHCLARRPLESWPWNLYTMLHGTDDGAVKNAAHEMAAAARAPEPLLLFTEEELKKSAPDYRLSHKEVRS